MIDRDLVSRAVTAYGKVIRIVIADVKGSAPRDAGVSMLVWADGLSGTIGGGRMELEAIRSARALLADTNNPQVVRQTLGPTIKRCCDGAVTLVFEHFDAAKLKEAFPASAQRGSYLRKVNAGSATPPYKLLRQWEAQASGPIELREGWLIEPTQHPRLPVLIYGAGNVGHALALVLAPLAQFDVHLVDVRDERFVGLPETIRQTWDRLPTDIMAEAPDEAAHFIMTPEHDYDLELCHRLLGCNFGYAGLIGSKTKWARFRKRLVALGHAEQRVDRIVCPIGNPSLGKEPQAIAIGVAAELLRHPYHQPAVQRNTV